MAKKQVTVSLRKPPSPEAVDTFVQKGADETPIVPVTTTNKRTRRPKNDASPTPPSVSPAPESGVQATTTATPIIEDHTPATAASEAIAEPTPIEVTPTVPVVGPGGITLRPITVYLPPDLAERLTLHCIQNDRNMSNVLSEAITNHLAPRLNAAPTPNTPKEETSGTTSQSWANTEKPFPRIDWPPRKIAEILEVGRVLFSVLRRRVSVA